MADEPNCVLCMCVGKSAVGFRLSRLSTGQVTRPPKLLSTCDAHSSYICIKIPKSVDGFALYLSGGKFGTRRLKPVPICVGLLVMFGLASYT